MHARELFFSTLTCRPYLLTHHLISSLLATSSSVYLPILCRTKRLRLYTYNVTQASDNCFSHLKHYLPLHTTSGVTDFSLIPIRDHGYLTPIDHGYTLFPHLCLHTRRRFTCACAIHTPLYPHIYTIHSWQSRLSAAMGRVWSPDLPNTLFFCLSGSLNP
jgi:hypothetical protein